MDLLLRLVLSSAPLAPADTLPEPAASALDPEFAQAVLMAEHRLAMPILIRVDSQDFQVIPAGAKSR
jgi:hypothetical protein